MEETAVNDGEFIANLLNLQSIDNYWITSANWPIFRIEIDDYSIRCMVKIISQKDDLRKK